jgi:hypothetical protein
MPPLLTSVLAAFEARPLRSRCPRERGVYPRDRLGEAARVTTVAELRHRPAWREAVEGVDTPLSQSHLPALQAAAPAQ